MKIQPSPNTRKTARLLVAAISDTSEFSTRGVSLQFIKDYIIQEFAVSEKEINRNLLRCLKSGIRFGAIKRYRGKYLLGDVLKKYHRRKKLIGETKRKMFKGPLKNKKKKSEQNP